MEEKISGTVEDTKSKREGQTEAKQYKRVRLTGAYDGTNYHGWQMQKNGITIESELNRCLRALLGEDIQVILSLIHI